MKRILAAVTSVVFLVGVAVAGIAGPADATAPTFTKYGETFTYDGGGQWTITNTDHDTTLENIGNQQGGTWLCNYNDVGPGVTTCTTGSYTFAGDTSVSGYNCAYIQGDGGKTNSNAWDTVPGDSSKNVCVSTTTSTPQDASAAIVDTPASCTAAETVSEGTAQNATWTPISYSGTGGRTYTAVATAVSGHEFPSGSNVTENNTVETFTGTLAAELTSGCAPPTPACIPNSDVSYTYASNDQNAGVITVKDVVGSTHVLCTPFYVTATSWTFTSDSIWPQARDVVDKLGEISTPGSYPFSAAVTCGQGDIYASTDADAPSLNPGSTLTSPSHPFVEEFLSDLGFSGGTSPTYVVDNPDCWTQPETGAPASTVATCAAPTDTLTLPAVPGGVWTITGSGYTQSYPSGQSVSLTDVPAGYQDYYVTLVDGSPNDSYSVTGGWWYWDTVSPASLDCASTGVPTESVATCTDQGGNSLILSPVDGGSWTVTGPGGYDFTGASLSLTGAPSGFGQYTITLNDVSSQDAYDVTGGPWTWTPFDASTSCDIQPAMPTADGITLCGTTGSIDIPNTPGVTYSLDGDVVPAGAITGLSGSHTVTATATDTLDGYALTGYPSGGWTFDLGSATTCGVSYQLSGTCTYSNSTSSEDLLLTFDNTNSTGTSTFEVNGQTYLVNGGQTGQADVGPVSSAGGLVQVFVNGTEQDVDVAPFTGCIPTGIVGDPSATPATCDAQTGTDNSDASISVDLEPGLSYTITGSGTAASFGTVTGIVLPQNGTPGDQIVETGVPAGGYTVTVTAIDGYALDPSIAAPTWPFALTVPATICDLGVTAQALDCSTNAAGTATITIVPVPYVDYTAYDSDDNSAYPLIQAVTDITDVGHYTVVATLTDNAPSSVVLPASGTTFGPFDLSAVCTLPTLPTWDANATGTNATCTSTGTTNGSIDLEHDADQTGDVVYTVVDSSTHQTVYTGTNTRAGDTTVSVPVGTYAVTAVPSNPADAGLSGNPNPDGSENWTIDITRAGLDCDGSLAFTGGTIAWLGVILAGGMLFLGAALMFVRRRARREAA